MSKKLTTTKLSPATEYWLNRILRDHASQIFIFGLVSLLIVLASIVHGIYTEGSNSNRQINSTTINVTNRSNTTIDGLTTTTNETVIMQDGEIISTPTVNQKDATYTCKNIIELTAFQICTTNIGYDFITGPNSMKIENVSSYSVSPNKNWLFIVTYSDEYVLSGGAPSENALVMVDVNNLKMHNLFTKIYFPNFTEDSWSPDGNGIVFTAGYFTLDGKEYGENPFAVVYCTTICRVVATDAGPAGIGADPAYYDNGEIYYTVYTE